MTTVKKGLDPRPCVIGLGNIGASLLALFAERWPTVGIDVSSDVVAGLLNGQPLTTEPGIAARLNEAKHITIQTTYTGQLGILQDRNLFFVIVPTPSMAHGKFSIQMVIEAVEYLGLRLAPNQQAAVVIVSTINPGDMATIEKTLTTAARRPLGPDLFCVYSPEFIKLGSVIHDLTHPDLVLFGIDRPYRDTELAVTLQMLWNEIANYAMQIVVDARNAEIAKLALNVFLDMKIAYGNQIAVLSEHLGGNAYEVLDVVRHDHRVGPAYIMPGTPPGGPCLPRDCQALLAAFPLALVHTVYSVNLHWMVQLTERIISKALSKGNTLGIIGLTYKDGVPVLQDSFGYSLLKSALDRGLKVYAYDSAMPELLAASAFVAGAHGMVRATTPREVLDHAGVVAITLPTIDVNEWGATDLTGTVLFDLFGTFKWLEGRGVERLVPGKSGGLYD